MSGLSRHLPPVQRPAPLRQGVLSGLNRSLEQVVTVPLHVSASSHSPAVARQTLVGEKNTSEGQALVLPSQFSALSQGPA